MAVKDILQLGNPALYRKCDPVEQDEVVSLSSVFTDMRDTLLDFRKQFGAGRAIAAPQIGVFKRVVFMEIDHPVVLINPELTVCSQEQIELWDDCMSFPDLLVRVSRHQSCKLCWRDQEWNQHSEQLTDDLSELLQHEVDHLDGILAVSRAIDEKSFALRSQREILDR